MRAVGKLGVEVWYCCCGCDDDDEEEEAKTPTLMSCSASGGGEAIFQKLGVVLLLLEKCNNPNLDHEVGDIASLEDTP